MKLPHVLAGSAVIALLMCGTAVGTTFVTSSSIADETITAADIGPDVTRVKTVTLTVPSEEPVTEERCFTTPQGEQQCADYVVNEATTKTRTVRCASGNVVSGGIRYAHDADLDNLTAQSFPADDGAWTWKLLNEGPDDVTVELRVICI